MAKGQVTVFLLLGIVLIVLTGLGFYLYQQSISFTDTELEKQTEVADSGVRGQIKSYVDNCLKRATLEGLDIMSKQGGYINIPAGVPYLPINGSNIPYWYDGQNDYSPSPDMLINQLRRHIDYKVVFCIANMGMDMANQGVIIQNSNTRTDIDLGSKVMVTFNTNLEAKTNDEKYTFDKFYYEVPINIPRLFSLLINMHKSQNSVNFLELYTDNVILINAWLPAGELMPYYDMDLRLFGNAQYQWGEAASKLKMREILAENIPLLRIINTKSKNDAWENHPWTAYQFFSGEFPNTRVDFEYDSSWADPDSVFEIVQDPNMNSISTLLSVLPIINMNEYRARYSAQYPVHFVITDEPSASILVDYSDYDESGEYGWSYLEKVMYNYNEGGLLNSYITQRQQDIQNSFDTMIQNSTVIQSVLTDNFTSTYNLSLLLGYCTNYLNDSGTVTEVFTVKNQLTDDPIEGVDVYVKCSSISTTCYQGVTAVDGTVEVNLPNCTGNVSVILDSANIGYLDVAIDLVSLNTTYYISPPINVTFDFEKIIAYDLVDGYTNSGTPRLNREPMVMTDELMVTMTGPGEYNNFLIYPINETFLLKPGLYNFSTMLMSNVTIPPMLSPNGSVLATGYAGQFLMGSFSLSKEILPENEGAEFLIPILSYVKPSEVESYSDVFMITVDENRSLIYNLTDILPYEEYEEYMEIRER